MLAALVVAASLQDLQSDMERWKGKLAEPSGVCALEARVDRKAKGAHFRKIESEPSAAWTGIRAEAVLPSVSFDPGRWHSNSEGQPMHWEGPLDRPSVYVGAHGEGFALDAGLTWDQQYTVDRRPTGRFGFRPYWRVTTIKGSPWANPPVGDPNYFEPGETVTLTLRRRADGFRLDIRSGDRHFVQLIEAPLEAGDELSFKRVNGLDQFRFEGGRRLGNEGFDVLPTATTLEGARWNAAWLLRRKGGVPLSGPACREVFGPQASGFVVLATSGSGELLQLGAAK